MSQIASDPEYQALLRYSARIGADPALVQAAGGNVSLKRGGVLWIKASGTWLADAEIKSIMVPVAMEPLLMALAEPGLGAEDALRFVDPALNPAGLRPSIETTMHAVLPHDVVVHVHCVNTIAVAALRGAEAVLAQLLEGLAWRFVPYVRPGVPLARAIQERPGADVLVLGNHGLVVGARSTEDARALLADVSRRLSRTRRAAPAVDIEALSRLAAGTDWRPAEDPATHAAATDPVSAALAVRGSYYPDHVIFLGPAALALEPGESIEGALQRRREQGKPPPPLILVPGKGALLRRDATPGAVALARCLSDVMSRLTEQDELTMLTASQEAELMGWDAEAYRRALDVIPAERVITRSEAANAARRPCGEAKQTGGLRPASEGSESGTLSDTCK